jgi:hypothetical protein
MLLRFRTMVGAFEIFTDAIQNLDGPGPFKRLVSKAYNH